MPVPVSTTLLHDDGSAMHWRLIFLLSLSGVVTGLGSSFGMTRGFEVYVCLAAAACVTIVLSLRVRKSIFLHGFVTGITAGVLDAAAKAVFLASYTAANPDVASDLAAVPSYVSGEGFLLMIGLAEGTVYGGVLGLLTWGGVKLFVRHRVTVA
jgi:hypothetical protein